ncbi:MAG: hypothetical protein ACJAZT_000525 [Gammaproteobacteria bacterium]|jgi:hypothetical protein
MYLDQLLNRNYIGDNNYRQLLNIFSGVCSALKSNLYINISIFLFVIFTGWYR